MFVCHFWEDCFCAHGNLCVAEEAGAVQWCSEHTNTNVRQTNTQETENRTTTKVIQTQLYLQSHDGELLFGYFSLPGFETHTHTHNREWVYVPSHSERFQILFCVKFSQVSKCVRHQERNRQRGSTCTQTAFSSENESPLLRISLRGLKKMKKLFLIPPTAQTTPMWRCGKSDSKC